MALTASANARVVASTKQTLGMRAPVDHKASFNRPNLHYSVHDKTKSTIDDVAAYIKARPEACGVIYCLSRRAVVRVAQDWLALPLRPVNLWKIWGYCAPRM